ncbi:MAG TPA: VCBS repeat-containing protein [Planctomycetes bacterium]|nr:VCBS repeat-containing protein [Planctomycetota bacterium]
MSRASRLACFSLALSLFASESAAQQELSVFNAPTVVLDQNDPPFRRMLDFDGDGWIDAVGMKVANRNRQFVLEVYANAGDGRLLPWASYTSSVLSPTGGGVPVLIEAADLNGDGRDGFVVALSKQIFVFSAMGTTISLDRTIAVAKTVQALALGDLDRDGIADILAGTATGLEAILSTGATISIPRDATLGSMRAIRLGDIDSDGLVDIVFSTKNKIQALLGDPSGVLQTGALLTPPISNAMVDLGDVDGDGLLDLAVFGSPADGTYIVYFGDGAGGFLAGAQEIGGPAEFLFDVDGDGDLDGVCCGGGSGGGGCSTCPTYSPNTRPSDFEISINDGTGHFAPSFVLHGVGSPQLAGAVDLDGDGDVDLVAGRAVYYAHGSVTDRNPTSPSTLPARLTMRDVTDIDGDGDPDLGFSLERCFVNDGTGSFQETPMQVAQAPFGTRFRGPGFPGDFDGDGDVDLLVEHLRLSPHFSAGPASAPSRGAGTEDGRLVGMRLLINDGTGQLLDGGPASAPGITFAVGSLDAKSSFTADLNLDGALDLITVGSDAIAESRIWLNDGTGRLFGAGRIQGAWIDHVTDQDHDGIPDLFGSVPSSLTFLEPSANMEVWRGTLLPGGLVGYQLVPGLTSASGVWYYPISSRPGLGFGDVFGGGYTDIVVTMSSPSQASVLWDQQAIGGWGFGGQASIRSNLGSSLAPDATTLIGDIDADALNDVVVGPWGNGEEVEIFDVMSKGAPASFWFDTVTAQVLPLGVLVDVDMDGDLDLVGSEVVLNRTIP